MNSLANLRYLTLHYRDLQGYRLLPFAGFFLLRAVYDVWPYNTDELWSGLYLSLTLVAYLIFAPFLSVNIGRWYERRYGYVAPPPETRRDAAVMLGLATLHLLTAFTFEFYGDNSLIMFGLGIIVYRLWKTFPDVRHMPQSVIWIAFGLDPAFYMGAQSNVRHHILIGLDKEYAVVLSLTAATLLFLTAIYNHRTLEQLSAAREAVSKETR